MTTISFYMSSKFSRLMTLAHIALKKRKKTLAMVSLIYLGNIDWMAIDNSCYIKVWQSSKFNLISFKYFINIRLLIFEKYPYDTLTPFKHLQKFIFFFLYKVRQVKCNFICWSLFFGAKYGRIAILSKFTFTLIPFWSSFICLRVFQWDYHRYFYPHASSHKDYTSQTSVTNNKD